MYFWMHSLRHFEDPYLPESPEQCLSIWDVFESLTQCHSRHKLSKALKILPLEPASTFS